MPPNSWRSPKVRRPRHVVEPIVQALTEELADDNPGLEFVFAGSWRRGTAEVGDLDIVVISDSPFTPTLFEPGVVLPSRVTWQRRGPRIAAGDIEVGDGLPPMHVDAFHFLPSSRGPALLALSGPAELNKAMRVRAARQRPSLALSQEALKVRDTGQVLDVPDEASVFAALGMRYETPEQRQRWVQGR